MGVKFTSNFAELAAKKPLEIGLAIRFAIDDIQATAEPNTPKRDGDLRSEVKKEVINTRGRIQWVSPYAAAQEAGIIHGGIVTNYTTPGTGKDFAKNAVEEVNARFDKHLRRSGAIK
jgi:hypothetical protein